MYPLSDPREACWRMKYRRLFPATFRLTSSIPATQSSTRTVSGMLVVIMAMNTATTVMTALNIWGQALGNRLPERIGIVGVNAHNIAVTMGVEIADRQRLHPGEQPVADLLENPLGNRHHDAIISECRQRSAK